MEVNKILFTFNFEAMKKFIFNTSLIFLAILISLIIIFIQADGTTDPYYLRFTSDKQSSLIIGTSRSAQGIIPDEVEKEVSESFFNYSFTVASSPYGPTYLNSIKRKLNTNQKGIFIVTVDPWSLSVNNKSNSIITENDRMLEKMNLVNVNPNFEYLLKCYSQKYYKIFSKKNSSTMLLHKNGWLEINVPMDEESIKKRTDIKIESYNQYLTSKTFSEERYNYLKSTINFLNQHGKVYLVRLPIDNKMMSIENKFMPNFNLKIFDLQPITSGYLDLTRYNSNFTYTDGNHLHKNSSKIVSKMIGEWIKLNP